MTQLIRAVAVSCAAAFLFVAAAGAQNQPSKGSSVTLTSCVEKGKDGKGFVLTHVADVPSFSASAHRVVYWFSKDDSDKMKAHVGHQVRISGRIDDVQSRELEMKKSDDGSLYVEVEGPGRDVKASPEKVGVSNARAGTGADAKTTVLVVKLDKLDMVAANCPLAR